MIAAFGYLRVAMSVASSPEDAEPVAEGLVKVDGQDVVVMKESDLFGIVG